MIGNEIVVKKPINEMSKKQLRKLVLRLAGERPIEVVPKAPKDK